MQKRAFPQWKGFEVQPLGYLMEQFVDLSGDWGVAYERSCNFYKDFHTHDRLMLIFPRGSSVMEVRTRGPRRSLRVDSKSILMVPKNLKHDDESVSSIYDTVALYPSDQIIARTLHAVGVSPAEANKRLKDCLLLPRSERTEHWIQEFLFECMFAGATVDQNAIQYLGRKILEEVFLLSFPDTALSKSVGSAVGARNSVATQALRYIELNLFQNIDLNKVAMESGASTSTLLRNFKAATGLTPVSYIRNRRLDEAHRLLQTGAHAVSEVAVLVGYENFGAFSEAFKNRFNKTPSAVNHRSRRK